MIMIPTMIDGSLLLYAFTLGGEGDRRPARSCLELEAIGRRHYSHRLRLPHGPIGLFSSLPSSFRPTSLPRSITALSLLSTSPFNPLPSFYIYIYISSFSLLHSPSLSLPSYLLLCDFRSFSHGLLVRFLHPVLPFCTPFPPWF